MGGLSATVLSVTNTGLPVLCVCMLVWMPSCAFELGLRFKYLLGCPPRLATAPYANVSAIPAVLLRPKRNR